MSQAPEPVSSTRLYAFIARCFTACGMPPKDAETAAELMTLADLMGQDGHGVFRLPMYIRRIRAGGMNMTPKFTRLKDRPATALIDGDNGLGHLVMHHATTLAMEKAEKTGIAWVGARHSNHAGPEYDRHLYRRGQCQPCAAMGGHGNAA